jgi:hypothetical protein
MTRRRFERLEERKLFSLSNFLMESSLPEESQESALIYLPEISGLRAASVELTYNQDLVKIDSKSLRAGSIWGNRGLAIANVDEEAGRIVAFIFASREVPAGAGSLLEFDFTHNESSHSSRDQLEFIIESLSLNEGKISAEAEGEGTAEVTWNRFMPDSDYSSKNHANDQKGKHPRISELENPGTMSIGSCFAANVQSKPEMVVVPGSETPPIPSATPTLPISMELPLIANQVPFQTLVSVVYGPEELRLDAQAAVETLENSTEIGSRQLLLPWYEAEKRPVVEEFLGSREYSQVEGKMEKVTDLLGGLPITEPLNGCEIVEIGSWNVTELAPHIESGLRKTLPPVLESNTRSNKIAG